MQKLIVLTLTLILGSGLVVAFVMYKQLGTDTTLLNGDAQLVSNGQGAECGEVSLSVGARTVGHWYFEVPKAKTITSSRWGP